MMRPQRDLAVRVIELVKGLLSIIDMAGEESHDGERKDGKSGDPRCV